MAIDSNPCTCPDAYYKDSMSWRWATLNLLCQIDELIAEKEIGGLHFVTANAPLTGLGTPVSPLGTNATLTSIGALPATLGLVRQTGANTFGIDVTAYASTTVTDGKLNLHGIEASGALSFVNATQVFTMASGTNTYWWKGTKYTTSAAITCTVGLAADRDNSSGTLTANKIYFLYFKDATGKLYWSDSPWSFTNNVFVATVYWNGSAGAVQKETHSSTRNIDWHIWAHDTIGTRYESGLDLVAPTTSNDSGLQINTGTIHDEDLDFSTGQLTTMRAWYKVSASVFTFADYSFPYLGTSGSPKYLRTTDYTLQTPAGNTYVCYWVYASLDVTRPLYIVPTMATAPYGTIAAARLETSPTFNNTGLNSEWKLIYRFIYRGDGEFQESVDYRSTSPVPGGGTPSLAAGSVSFSPTGTITSSNVQAALEELDTSAQVDRIVFAVGDGVNPITAGLKKCIEVTQSCTINKWTILSDDAATTTGSIAFDIYRTTLGTYPPVLANSIVGAGTKPTLTAAKSAQQLTISGWTSVSLVKGDILRINVEATPSSVTSVTLILGVTRT